MAAKPYHPYMSRPRCSSAGGGIFIASKSYYFSNV